MPVLPTDLTDDELAAVTALIRRAAEEDRFPRAPRLDPLRSALAKLDSAAGGELSPQTKAARESAARQAVIRIAITAAAFEAIKATLRRAGKLKPKRAEERQRSRENYGR